MSKPITVAYREFNQGLVELINNSGLPAFTVASALKDCLTEVEHLAEAQLKADTEAWEKENTKDAI